jgi:hypothetical protein
MISYCAISKPQLRIWLHLHLNQACRVPEPQPDISRYQKLCREFRSTWNSARNYPVPVLQLSILGTCTWTRYLTVFGIQPEILLYLNLSQAFCVPEPQQHISRLQKFSHVLHDSWTSTICFGYLKLSHLFSGPWTSTGMLITYFINYCLTHFMKFFYIMEKSDDFLKQEGNLA